MYQTSLAPQTRAAVRRMRVRHDGRILRAIIRDDRIAFTGAVTGEHSLAIACSCVDRVVAHWEGYLEANNIDPRRTAGGVWRSQHATNSSNDRIIATTDIGARGAIYGRCLYRSGRVGTKIRIHPR